MTAHDKEAGHAEEPLATASRIASRYRTLRAAVRHVLMRWSDPSARFAPPGHFYSPLPDRSFVEQRRATLFDSAVTEIPGIDLDAARQLQLVAELSRFYGEIPWRDEVATGLRYGFGNPFFCHGDAIVLYSLLRHLRPKRVIEVGSGFSSAVMLDTNDLFLARETQFTFIEPHPARLLSLLSAEDRRRHTIDTRIVQDVEIDRFRSLERNDILFIDSSHVAKIGSDIVHLLTHVLPTLRPGVVVHFHDVFWPFEYPEEWVVQGRAWNESYVLKAFLQFNGAFRICLFNSYLAVHHRPAMTGAIPRFLENPGGSLWIARVG